MKSEILRRGHAPHSPPAPYREARHKADVACEYEGGRSANVSEKVSVLVEKTDKGVRVIANGRPDTKQVAHLPA